MEKNQPHIVRMDNGEIHRQKLTPYCRIRNIEKRHSIFMSVLSSIWDDIKSTPHLYYKSWYFNPIFDSENESIMSDDYFILTEYVPKLIQSVSI